LLLRGYSGNFSGFRAACTAPATNRNKQQPTGTATIDLYNPFPDQLTGEQGLKGQALLLHGSIQVLADDSTDGIGYFVKMMLDAQTMAMKKVERTLKKPESSRFIQTH
jgi:hypothetical protein